MAFVDPSLPGFSGSSQVWFYVQVEHLPRPFNFENRIWHSTALQTEVVPDLRSSCPSQEELRFALCVVEARAISTSAVPGALVPVLDHFRAVGRRSRRIPATARGGEPRPRELSRRSGAVRRPATKTPSEQLGPLWMCLTRLFCTFGRLVCIRLLRPILGPGGVGRGGGVGTRAAAAGNDLTGSPALMVGDEGLTSGPMVAMALLGGESAGETKTRVDASRSRDRHRWRRSRDFLDFSDGKLSLIR